MPSSTVFRRLAVPISHLHQAPVRNWSMAGEQVLSHSAVLENAPTTGSDTELMQLHEQLRSTATEQPS
jgi:hypothetical protein